MQYTDVAAVYLTPSADDIPEPAVPDSPARRLRDVLEPIATIGWWAPEAGEQFATNGLDFISGYVWGRAAALGPDVANDVVAAAFGVFDPAMLDAVLGQARQAASHEQILSSREAGAGAGLAAALSDATMSDTAMNDLDRMTQSLRSALDSVDVTARPFFSALRSLPVSDDPHVALWRAAEMYREHRGDGHLAACIGAGLDAVEMNVLTELWLDYPAGEYSGTRGFGPERIDAALRSLGDRGWVDVDERTLTAAGRGARDRIEAATDESQRAVIDALGSDIEELITDFEPIAAAVIAARAAPADPRKRAAG